MKVGRYIPFAFILLGVVLMLGCEDKPKTENVDSFFDGKNVSTSLAKPADKPEPDPEAPKALEMAPTAAISLAANGLIIELTLKEAVGAVTWSVATATGEIVTSGNTGATYRRIAAGDNVVTAKDSAGRTAFKVITQPAP